MARLATYVGPAGAALRLVADPAQHSAVAAGGAWRALVEESIRYGELFDLEVSSHGISRVVLLRAGSATHGFNSDQRAVGLNFSDVPHQRGS